MRKLVGLILVFLLLLTACSNGEQPSISKKEYEHIPYVSDLSQEECFVCGENPNHPTSSYWGEDNVGILNLNTFEVLYIEINRYDDNGQLIEETAGYMQMHSMSNGESYVHSSDNPDRGLSHIQIQGDRKPIDAKAIQSFLCQTCLDKINDMYFGDYPPEEYAVVNFSDKSIRPLIKNTTWFTFGNFDVDCDFEEDGDIDLLIHYCPPRYKG
jgi:hypothetical protein